MTLASDSVPVISMAGVEMQRSTGDSTFRIVVERLDLRRGVPVLLVGENGSGKSSLLDLIGLVARPRSTKRFQYHDGRSETPVNLAALFAGGHDSALTRIRCSEIGYMPQSGGLVSFLSVRDNIRLPAELCGRLDVEFLDRLCAALEIAAIQLALRPQDLSIGQRQRVCLARAFSHRPRLLLADEPTAALDAVSAATVAEMLIGTAPEWGMTPVIATHDTRLTGDARAQKVRLHATSIGRTEIECRVGGAAA